MSSTWVSAGYQLEVRGDAAVDREEPLVDDAGQRHEVEAVHDYVVGFLVELRETLHSEVHVGSHAAALVIPSQEVHVLREVELQRVEQQHDFYREVASVYEIPQKEVPGSPARTSCCCSGCRPAPAASRSRSTARGCRRRSRAAPAGRAGFLRSLLEAGLLR